jgi:hypothetical protein
MNIIVQSDSSISQIIYEDINCETTWFMMNVEVYSERVSRDRVEIGRIMTE